MLAYTVRQHVIRAGCLALLCASLCLLAVSSQAEDAGAPDNGGEIHLPVTLHPVRESGSISSHRSDGNILSLAADAQAIWRKAGIVFDVALEKVRLETAAGQALSVGDLNRFYQAIEPDGHGLHIFFVSSLDGLNGVAISPRLAWVADTTHVDDFRATAHEIGHLLGLKHTRESRSRLLFPGTNGTELSEAEILLARRHARWMNSRGP